MYQHKKCGLNIGCDAIPMVYEDKMLSPFLKFMRVQFACILQSPLSMYVLVVLMVIFLFVQVSTLTPSNHTPEPRPLVRAGPREQEATCPDWQCEVRRRGRAPGNTQLYHTHTYNESWPTTSCSSQQTPPTSPQAPPTTHSQRSSCDEDVSVERALVFEEEEERRPSLAR